MTALYNQAQTDTKTFATAETGATATAQMADADITTYDADFTYLSRSDWTGTCRPPTRMAAGRPRKPF